MADGITLDPGAGGAEVATDDCGADGHAQLFKLAYSADGVATLVTADGNGLEVQLGAALPAGTNNIGDVDVLSLPALPAGTNNIGDVDLASAVPAGTNAIGKVGHDTTTGGVGRKTVTTAGTQLALAASTAAKWVIITAETDNTGLIAVGIGDAVAAAGSQEGTILAAGDVCTLLIDNLSEVFVDCTVNGDGVAFTYGA